MNDVPDERAVYNDEDTPEQQTRCRALEMAVLLRALLDATWKEVDAEHWKTNKQRLSDIRRMQLRRTEARRWWTDDDNRPHIDDIAACAGLPHGHIWRLVDRFVIAGDDPGPLRLLYDMMSDRPGTKKFDFDVAFVA